MEQIEVVTIQQMKDTLAKEAGSKFPLKITLKSGQVIIRYVRGFADQQSNILLISENPYSLAMRILEIKDILVLQFANENTDGHWKTLQAR